MEARKKGDRKQSVTKNTFTELTTNDVLPPNRLHLTIIIAL
jgi:hypothetical protein